jgi:hypothetical protein
MTAAATPHDGGVLQRPCPPVLRCLSLARGGWGGRRHDRGRAKLPERSANIILSEQNGLRINGSGPEAPRNEQYLTVLDMSVPWAGLPPRL